MGRYTLNFFNLETNPGSDLCLKIPLGEIYSSVVDRAFPRLDRISWHEASKGTYYTYIKSIDEEDEDRLNVFLRRLKKILYLTKSEHLDPYFSSELDEAYALDFNFQQDVEPLTYTRVGQLEHDAKELQCGSAIARLARRMTKVIHDHPTLSRADIIAAAPPRPGKGFHLPDSLVEAIGVNLPRPVGLRIKKRGVPKLRSLALDEKITTLAGAFTLDESVRRKTVLIVDDLYQSGATLWSIARFLKDHGAREVYGLACVKSWRDTDNVA
jgi:Phosphoribosyl transferase domain